MHIVAAQKRKQHLHDLAETRKLLVPAGFPRLTRDYRLGMPGGELALLPDPESMPRDERATTVFAVTFFPELGVPVDVGDWEDERWLEYLRTRIEDLKNQS